MRLSPPRITVSSLILAAFAAVAVASGSSSNGAYRSAQTSATLSEVRVTMPDLTFPQGTNITVPITVSDLTGLGAIAYDIQITFDPDVIIPASPAVDTTGTLSSSMSVSPNTNNPGHIIIPAYGAGQPLTGAGTLINLKFTVIGTAGMATPMAFESYTDPNNIFHPAFAFNEGDPGSATTNGSVRILDIAISGTVTYGNSVGEPTPRFVSNVTLTGTGSSTVTATTHAPGTTAGRYWLAGFGSGPYVVTPSKTGDWGFAINSFDAARISRHVANIPPLLTGTQLTVADVSANGIVSSFDAAQLSAFVVHAPIGGWAGTWKFSPVSRVYASADSDLTGQDYSALLIGDVTGNWTNTGGARPGSDRAGGPERTINVTASTLAAQADTGIVVPVTIHTLKTDIISYEFELRYDPSVIQPQASPVDLTGSLSQALKTAVNAGEPGLLRVAVYGPMPIAGGGVLFNLRFTAVGKPGAVSSLTFERIMFNEGTSKVTAAGGQIELY